MMTSNVSNLKTNVSTINSSVSNSNNSNNRSANSPSYLISQALRNHLKSTGLLGECSDIRLKTFGRIYSVHRLLLIQSGFFNSMLLSGFKEGLDLEDAAAKRNKVRRGSKGKGQRKRSQLDSQSEQDGEGDDDDDSDVIELHLDDPQITRPAFEYAIAHLYGAAPELVLPIWSSPSAEEPLTPLFGPPSASLNDRSDSTPTLSEDEDSSIGRNSDSPSNDQQPATPRFLCSLIATSIYLGLPALTSQALTLILCSITPFTVKHYLHFAIGRGIAGASEARMRQMEVSQADLWDWELEGPVRGLESFGKSYPSSSTYSGINYGSDRPEEEEADVSSGSDQGRTGSTTPSASGGQPTEFSMEDSRKRGRGEAAFSSPPRPAIKSAFKKNRTREPSHFKRQNRAVYMYGSVGEKIGEACACWLSRWGAEVFEVEDMVSRGPDGQIQPSAEKCGQLFCDAGTLPSFALVMANPPPLSVWSKGSMPSSWVRAIISSDSFFIPDEWSRYVTATRVVDMRRGQKRHHNDDEMASSQSNEDEYESIESDEEEHSPVDKRFGHGFGSSSINLDSNRKSAGASSKKQKSRIPIRVKDHEDHDTIRRSKSQMDQEADDKEESDLSDCDSEEEYSRLFSEGIYYTHMDFNRLEQISGLGYAPQNVLHSALWRSSALQNSIKASEIAALKGSSVSPNTSVENNEPTEAELMASTLSQSLSLLDFFKAQEASKSRASSPFTGARSGTPLPALGSLSLGGATSSTPMPDLSRRYYPVPVDDTIRLGDGLASLSSNTSNLSEASGEASATGVAALVDPNTLALPPSLNNRQTHNSPPVGGPLIETSVKGFFGLDSWVRNGHEIAARGAKVAEQPIEDCGDETVSSIQGDNETEKEGSEVQESNEDGRELGEEVDEQNRSDGSDPEEVEEDEQADPEDGGEAQEAAAPPQITNASSIPSHLRANERSSGTPPPGRPIPSPSKKKGIPSSPPPTTSSLSPLLTQEHWSGFEPMRVSFEFFGVDKLQEKQRLYSPTFSFAGSLWNVYVQTLKKPKGLQLGVYLHRQNPLDSLPPYSVPSPPSNPNENQSSESGSRKTATVIAASPGVSTSSNGASVFYPSSPAAGSGPSTGLSATNTSNQQSNSNIGAYRPYSLLSSTSTSANSQPNLKAAEMPPMVYNDSRRVLKASFSIHCPSPLGTALTRFSSAPDQFTLSQSWGWKSSSLLGSTYLKDGVVGSVKTETAGRFRCCCVIGLV